MKSQEKLEWLNLGCGDECVGPGWGLIDLDSVRSEKGPYRGSEGPARWLDE